MELEVVRRLHEKKNAIICDFIQCDIMHKRSNQKHEKKKN